VQLQDRLSDIRAQGLGLAAISYDPPAKLRTFADRYGVTFPLLSDTGSAVIRRFGLLNRQVDEKSPAFGVPHPGTFILDAKGVVTRRFFEASYEERDATSAILLELGSAPGGTATRVQTRHLQATIAVSDRDIAPGHRFSVVFDVTPAPGMHVYARGQHEYRPFAPLFDASPALVFGEPAWPPSREYFFAPLKERVPVYDTPFRLTMPVMLKVAEGNDLLKTTTSLTIGGILSYQACDDKICYLPEKIPFQLNVGLKPLIRGRLP
jgi:hypothetical protein